MNNSKVRSYHSRYNPKIPALFFLSILVFAFIVVITLPRILIPLGFAYVLYFLFTPLVKWLDRHSFTRFSSILVVFGILILLIGYPLSLALPTLQDEVKSIQNEYPKFEMLIRQNYFTYTAYIKQKTGLEFQEQLFETGLNLLKAGTQDTIIYLTNILAKFFEWLILIPIFLIFMLRDATSFKKFILDLTPNSIIESFYVILWKFNTQLGNYLTAKFFEASFVGLLTGIILMTAGVPYWFILGLIAGITNIIPYAGPILGALPGILLTVIDGGFSSSVVTVTLIYSFVNLLDLVILFPLLMSRTVKLHPVFVIISVLIGSQYLGVLGMVISVPLAASISLLTSEIYKEISK